MKDYVAEYYHVDSANFVRPFYPGGDYENYDYPKNAIVVDNPPFSKWNEILDFYHNRQIPYFMFAPTMCSRTAMRRNGVCVIVVDCKIRTDPDLYRRLSGKNGKILTDYQYPDNVIYSGGLAHLSKHGELKIHPDECHYIPALDEQRQAGKSIYGGGLLVSDAAAERQREAKAKCPNRIKEWHLSDRERQIVEELNKQQIKRD